MLQLYKYTRKKKNIYIYTFFYETSFKIRVLWLSAKQNETHVAYGPLISRNAAFPSMNAGEKRRGQCADRAGKGGEGERRNGGTSIFCRTSE